jgi:hypothetical protein
MGLGFSIFLMAVGAILAFAVDYQVAEVNIQAAGVILMVVGAIGALLSLLFWSSIGSWRPGYARPQRTIVREQPTMIYREPTTTVVEEPVRYRRVDHVVTRGEGGDQNEQVIIRDD